MGVQERFLECLVFKGFGSNKGLCQRGGTESSGGRSHSLAWSQYFWNLSNRCFLRCGCLTCKYRSESASTSNHHTTGNL